jgi:hypothetical protein
MPGSAISRRVLMIGAAAAAATGAANAATLGTPSEKPILTIAGKIAAPNNGATVEFDRAMLEGLGTVSFETTTPWFTGPVTFEGVPMAKLMETVGATGDRVIATALNDYSSEIPVEDFARYGVILALKRNGEYMPVRDKGPLFIVYPYDSSPELKTQKFFSRSVWQIKRLEVR